jgi:aminodeoxyfutalosine deaminase
MPQYRVAWLLPISQPPIRDAWLRTERGRVVAFGHSRPGDFTPSDEVDLGDVAVLPGLVNAHTHLELSWMRGRLGASDDFDRWKRDIIALKQGSAGLDLAPIVDDAIAEARAFGTAVIGDITNQFMTSRALERHGLAGVVFYELLGFTSADAAAIMNEATRTVEAQPSTDLIRHSFAPHAPYSVSPALFGLIRAALAHDPFSRSSVHLGEGASEIEFLHCGTGPCRALLEELGKWDSSWVAPRCNPVEYLDRMGFIDDRVLVVHGVRFSEADLTRIAARGSTIVTCPRGNRLTGAGSPPLTEFFESDARIAVGTDSLASVPDLNVFAELAEMRSLAPEVPPRLLLETATINGARALGFESDFGVIEAGKRDRLIAVTLEDPVSSIEEYLVSGIDADQIRWLS